MISTAPTRPPSTSCCRRGVLSVRTASSTTTAVDGYLTLGAGNRLSIDAPAVVAVDLVSDGGRTCVPAATVDEARDAARDQSGGRSSARSATRWRRAGLTTGVAARRPRCSRSPHPTGAST